MGDEGWRADRQVVLVAVEQDGIALVHAPWRLRRDREVVLTAVTSRGCALQYAADDLTRVSEIAWIAVKQDKSALRFVHTALRSDETWMRNAFPALNSPRHRHFLRQGFH